MIRSLISYIPYALVKYLPQTSLIVPYYHMISDEIVPHLKHLYAYKNVREFKNDLEFLLRHYTAIGLPDLLKALRRDAALPKRSFLLTFDDGFREMSEVVAPLLYSMGVPATFFIASAFTDNRALCYQHAASILAERLLQVSSPVLNAKIRTAIAASGTETDDLSAAITSLPYQQRAVIDTVARLVGMDTHAYLQRERPYLTSEQITDLIRKGFTIGAHSIDHPLYATLSFEEQLRQTRESVQFVRKTYGLNYSAFAFPHHDRGVSMQFFTQLYGADQLDVSFGTGGLIDDAWPRNIQRISFERPQAPAKNIVVYAAAQGLYRTVRGRARQPRQ